MLNRLKSGISLRGIHVWMIVLTVVMSCSVTLSTFVLSNSFTQLKEASATYIKLEDAAHELMNASDYLTENAQRFAVSGDIRFLDAYFREVLKSKRRERALDVLDKGENAEHALKELKEAMQGSNKLMEREYYAMYLRIVSLGYTQYPAQLNNVALSEEDKALSDKEKTDKAISMLLDNKYYEQKDVIRNSIKACLVEIKELTHDVEDYEYNRLKNDIVIVRIVVILFIFSILIMVWLTSYLGINPILRAASRIKADKKIPEIGADEFRYLAKTYNKMYAAHKSSLEKLNFKASHDELTGVYNRSGYELITSGLDLNTTYMMLIDVDNFKGINDTYGHETGDKALVKISRALKHAVREDDYICRIGGDEFVVLMVHSGGLEESMIKKKIEQINNEIGNTDDGLPPLSISVGVIHGQNVLSTESMFEKADKAIYEAKQHGKHTYTFCREG